MAKALCKVLSDTQCPSGLRVMLRTVRTDWLVRGVMETCCKLPRYNCGMSRALLLLFSEFLTRAAGFTNEDICKFVLWTCCLVQMQKF